MIDVPYVLRPVPRAVRRRRRPRPGSRPRSRSSATRVARFEAARASGESSAAGAAASRRRPAALRDLRLDEAVELALAQNLDIAVERLSPQVTDFQIAGLRGAYRPVASSSLGQRSQVNPPTNQLNGGQRVANDTTTYNFGVSQDRPVGRRQLPDAASTTAGCRPTTCSPTSTRTTPRPSPPPTTSRCCAASASTPSGSRSPSPRSTARSPRRRCGRPSRSTIANVRNAYWDLAYARAAVDVAQRSLELAEKLVEDNQARVEVGTLAPIDVVQAEAEAATRRQTLAQAEATLATAQLALKRYIVSGTSDPLWTRRSCAPWTCPQLDSTPIDIEGAVRRALDRRTDLEALRKNLDSNDITLRYWRNESRPALDLQVNYGAQGIGGTQFIREGTGIGSQVTGTVPGGYNDALSLLGARDFPTWNAAVTFSYPIGGSHRRRPVRADPGPAQPAEHPAAGARAHGGRRGDQRRAAGRRPTCRRVDAARAARELAVEAARGRAEQVRGRPVDQLLRGPGAARPGRRRRTWNCARSPTCRSRR